MKKKITVISLVALLTILLAGTIFGILWKVIGVTDEVKPIDLEMFSAYNPDVEEFKNVPVMETNGKIDLDILNPEEIDAARKERNLDDPQPLKNNEDQDLGTHKSKGKGKHKGKKHVYVRS